MEVLPAQLQELCTLVFSRVLEKPTGGYRGWAKKSMRFVVYIPIYIMDSRYELGFCIAGVFVFMDSTRMQEITIKLLASNMQIQGGAWPCWDGFKQTNMWWVVVMCEESECVLF